MKRLFILCIILLISSLSALPVISCQKTVETPAVTPAPSPTPTPSTSPTPSIFPPTQATTATPEPFVNRTTHGRIRWDETWRDEINIIGDIIVEEGFTLTIEPGTRVLIAANSDIDNLNTDPILMKQGVNHTSQEERGIKPGEPYWDEGNHISIKILGTLHAVGTPNEMITITSDSPTPSRYDWNHFQFYKGILSYAVVEYYWALGAGEGAIVSHNTLRHIGGCAVCWGFGSTIVEFNTIYDTGHEMIGTLNNSHVIRNNQLGPSNENGIVVEGINAQPQITGNTIEGCEAGVAIISGSPHISSNTIKDCEKGIAIRAESEAIVIDEDAILKDNAFSNNEKDIAYIRLPTWAQPPQQTSELDIVKDVLKVEYVADGYKVESVLPSAFGLPKQLALLPNGDIIITDFSFKRLQILSNGDLSTLVGSGEVQANAAAVMPDGRVCYVSRDNHLILIEPITHNKETYGIVPQGERVQALAADNSSNVYAVTKNNKLYQFNKDGQRRLITTDLPFEQEITPTISDMDVAQDGTIYVSGFNYLVAVDSKGSINILTDDLNYEPTWCEVSPDGKLYIKDIASGVRQINPITGELIPIKIDISTGVSDLLALSADDFLFFNGTDIIFKYNLATHETTSIFINAVNSSAFATDDDGVFLATPALKPLLKSHIIRIGSDGTKQGLAQLTFDFIQAVDVDDENRLNLYADGQFHRLEVDGSVNSVIPKFPSEQRIRGRTNFTVGPGNFGYCITRSDNTIQVWRVDKSGEVEFLPISFNKASFVDAYRLGDVRIDIGNDGKLALIVTALGSKGQGPFFQRVYQAKADGTNLVEVANFDSKRIDGLVDIAVDHDNNIFVYVCQEGTTGSGEVIYRISNKMEISTLVKIGAGRDPKSIDVDSHGNVWFCTTIGVFRITPD
jgi:hypothetical protein